MKCYFKSLASCRTRTEQMRQYERYASAAGHRIVNILEEADAIILWTCAFREDYKQISLKKIDEYLSSTSDRKLIIAGCLLDIDQDCLPAQSSRVNCIRWKSDSRDLPAVFNSDLPAEDFIKPLAEEKLCDNAAEYRRQHPESAAMFADQFNKLIISSGCFYNCAYCSEKLAFPPYKSHSVSVLVQRARELYEKNGISEFCLMADSLGQYGRDIGLSLPRLIDEMRELVGPLTFALNNLNPACVLNDLVNYARLIRESAFVHLNLPIQSASDKMLKLMKREYTRGDLERLYAMLEEEKFDNHDTHLLVGFPGEADDDIDETIAFLHHHTPRYILLSRFMACKGTVADTLPDKVPDEKAWPRIRRIAEDMQRLGVICNYDGSEISSDRQTRLARD